MVQRGPQRVRSFLSFFLFCSALKASPLVQLQLEAPPECPSKDSIEQTLTRLVQRAPAAPLLVNARLAPDAERWVLVAMLEGGQRVVGGDSCVAVAEALVVIMALAIDPASPVNSAALQDFERANASKAQPPPSTNSVPVAPAGPSPAPTPAPNAIEWKPVGGNWRMFEDQTGAHVSAPMWPNSKPDRFGAAMFLLGEWGALPGPSFGPALSVRYGSPVRWGEFAVSGLWPRMKYESGSNTKGARFELLLAQVAGCAALGSGLPVAACAGAELGDLIGQGVHTNADVTRHTPWFAFAAGLVARGNLGGDWGLELRLGAAAPLHRQDFDVEGAGLRFTPRAISGRGFLGLSWR